MDGAARLLEKRVIPTFRLHAARSDEDTVFHDYNPVADESVLTGAGPNAQTFAFPPRIAKMSLEKCRFGFIVDSSRSLMLRVARERPRAEIARARRWF